MTIVGRDQIGVAMLKKTVALNASGIVHTPATGKKSRIYAIKFSADASLDSVSFRWESGGVDFEKYLKVVAGGFYGGRAGLDYLEGVANAQLYCVIVGAGNIQINLEYTEV